MNDLASIWDQALQHPQGVTITTESPLKLRHSLYQFRLKERKKSKKRWPIDSDEYGASPWDDLAIAITGPHELVISHNSGIRFSIKANPLPGDEAAAIVNGEKP